MATHDYVIANQTGANTRSDLNNVFSAIVSQNSNATAPSTTYAFMWWADTANDLLKIRNSANSAWVNILTLSTGAPSTDSDTTYTAGDGLDLTTTEFSLDLKANGGLAIDTTELKLDLTQDQSWTGSQRGTIVTDNDGSFDMDGGNNFKCTPTGNFTLTFTNITDGQSGFILLVNSGGQTVSAHANTKVDANLLATVSTAGTYLISYFSDGTNVYLTNSAIYA